MNKIEERVKELEERFEDRFGSFPRKTEEEGKADFLIIENSGVVHLNYWKKGSRYPVTLCVLVNEDMPTVMGKIGDFLVEEYKEYHETL